MQKFIKLLLLFSLPILVFYTANELYCRTATTFAIKKMQFENNLNSVEVLFLGSSHTQNALNPEFISKKTCNLAFGGQPISIDYYLLDKYIDRMPKLKTVFFEVSPHRFYNDLDITAWNGYIYSNLYDIDYKVKPISFSNYSLVFSNYKFFNSIFIDYCNPKSYKYRINEYGFIVNDFNDRFHKLKYDSIRISQSYKMLHEFGDDKNFRINKLFLKKLIVRCKSKDVEVVFLATPLYKTYLDKIPADAKNEVAGLVNKYINEFGISKIDFSEDAKFNIHDFKNDNHLNPDGAKKMTMKTDSLINVGFKNKIR